MELDFPTEEEAYCVLSELEYFYQEEQYREEEYNGRENKRDTN